MSNTTGPIKRSNSSHLKNLTVDGYFKNIGLSNDGNIFYFDQHHMVDKYINTNGNISTASGWDSIGVFKIKDNTEYVVYDNTSGITYILIGAYNDENVSSSTCINPRVPTTRITNGYKFITPSGTTHLVITVDNTHTDVNIPTIILTEGDKNLGDVYHLFKLDGNNEFGWVSRTDDMVGYIKNDQFKDNEINRQKLKKDVIDDLLTDSDEYYVRKKLTPLNDNFDDKYNNAVIGFYKNEVNVDKGGNNLIKYHTGGDTISDTLKRIYDYDLNHYYNRANLIRLNIQYQSSGTSIYDPVLLIRISNDDLKKIGIDVTDSNYTTKYINIRSSIGNYVGWNNNQYWVTLCYTHDPFYYNSYILREDTYLITSYSDGVVSPSTAYYDIINNNSGKTLSITSTTYTENDFTFKIGTNIPIYKELYVEDTGTTSSFKGILLQFLGSGSNSNTTIERGFDIHSIAVVNKNEYDNLLPSTNVKNKPSDIILSDFNLNDLYDVNTSGQTNNDILVYSGDTWVSSELTIDSINDVNIVDLTDGEQLIYSGDTWVNKPQGSQYMPANPVGLLKVSDNMFIYPDNHMVDKYIGTTGNISTASGWDSIGVFEVEPDTEYAVYDNSSGITYILIGVYNSETVNSSTCIDPRLSHTSITNGYTFKTTTGTTHLVITVDNSHSDVYIPTINLIKGNTNEGDKFDTYRLNKDVENGWFVRSQDLVGYIKYNQLNSGITDKLLNDADKWHLRDANEPLNPNSHSIINAVSNLYSTNENVIYGANEMFNFSTYSSASSTLKRVYDSDISLYYKRANLIRLRCEYDSSGASKYYPSLVIKLNNDDLKKIDIDVESTGYTTQIVNIRNSVENYVGWVGHQLWLTLCYIHEPNYYDHYTTSEVSYTYSNSVRHPLDGDIESDNSGLDFSVTGSTETDNGITFQYFNGVHIHKNVTIDSTSYQFKGIIIHILGSSGNNSGETIRGFDFHSTAVVNNSTIDNITSSTDVRNKPDDIQFSSIKMGDLLDVSTSNISNNDILIYDSNTEMWKSDTLDNTIQKVTIKNSDKIAFYGSSYTESAYAVKHKSWVNKVSQLTDWGVANMGQSGNRLTDEVERLRNNSNPYHTNIGVKDLSPTLVSFSNIGNETLEDLKNLDMYRQELIYAYQHVKSIGAEMIIGSEHITNSSVEMQMYALGKELGVLTCPIGVVGSRVLSNGYLGFWGGGHPATRTNAHSFIEWMYFIDQLPRPKKSIKIFRVRSSYKSGNPTYLDLGYDTILQRYRYFQEINCGENSLNEINGQGGWEYYDRLDENFDIVKNNNEYCNIMDSTNVQFSGFSLIEIVIDRINPKTLDIYIKTDVEPDNIYLSNNNDPNTQYDENRNGDAFQVTKSVYNSFTTISTGTTFSSDATGTGLTYTGQVKGTHLDGYWLFFNSTKSAESGGSGYLSGNTTQYEYIKCDPLLGRHKINLFKKWENNWSNFVNYSGYSYNNNYIKISLSNDFRNYLQYDKIKILIEKNSSFNISDVYADYSGGEIKRQVINPKFNLKPDYKELNKYRGFNTDWQTNGNWSTNSESGATLVTIPSSLEDYPPINNVKKHIVLGFNTDGFSQYIEKTFNINKSDIPEKGLLKVVIRVVARLYPKIFNTTVSEDSYHTQTRQITQDSYDGGTLVCLVDTTENKLALMKKVVDIGWSEIYFETFLSKEDANKFKIRLYRDEQDNIDSNYKNTNFPLQVYDVSVQIENQPIMPDLGDNYNIVYKDDSNNSGYNADSGLTWDKTTSGNTLNVYGNIKTNQLILNTGSTTYFNGSIKYDNNSIWLNTGGTNSGWVQYVRPIRYEMTAVGGETGFTITNDVNDNAQIFINGSLKFSDDYTISGSTIEFDTSLSSSDKVVVINYI